MGLIGFNGSDRTGWCFRQQLYNSGVFYRQTVNLTVLDLLTTYSGCKIEKMIFVTPVVSYAHNIIGVLTVNGKMALTYHSMENGNGADKNFFDRSIKNLIL